MNYQNHSCPYCGKPFGAEDDVVVCPVCATPQHRECWTENGHCANEGLHGSDFVWNGKNNSQSATEVSVPESGSDTVICHICGSENPDEAHHCGNCGALLNQRDTETTSGNKACSFCGKENDSDALHCKNCGAPLEKDKFYYNDNPYLVGTGVTPDELIGGMRAGDIALFTQTNTKRYIPKFKRFANGKKLSFNLAAFFFAPYWFFFRKLYKAGIFFTVLFATVSLMLSGFATEIVETYDTYAGIINEFDYENATEEEFAAFEAEALKISDEILNKIKKPTLIILGTDILMHLLCALLADRLYYKKLKEDLKLIDDGIAEPNMRKLMISRRGGLSPLAFAVSIMGYNSLVQLLVSGAEMLMNSF